MSEPNEQSEATQQETGEAQDDTESRVEGTEDAVANLPRYCDPTLQPATCSQPSQQEILEQYVVLKATLAGPQQGVDLSKEKVVVIDEHGNATSTTVIDLDNNRVNFPQYPCNFFSPTPPFVPPDTQATLRVQWPLPNPQPLLLALTGTCQGCSDETCFPGRDVRIRREHIGTQGR
jgi:hypothetical protein